MNQSSFGSFFPELSQDAVCLYSVCVYTVSLYALGEFKKDFFEILKFKMEGKLYWGK